MRQISSTVFRFSVPRLSGLHYTSNWVSNLVFENYLLLHYGGEILLLKNWSPSLKYSNGGNELADASDRLSWFGLNSNCCCKRYHHRRSSSFFEANFSLSRFSRWCLIQILEFMNPLLQNRKLKWLFYLVQFNPQRIQNLVIFIVQQNISTDSFRHHEYHECACQRKQENFNFCGSYFGTQSKLS